MIQALPRSSFFNDTATTEIYTLSLHDALPISCHDGRRPTRAGRPTEDGRCCACPANRPVPVPGAAPPGEGPRCPRDRKSTRLNSSHANISYAVFCLKKKNIYCRFLIAKK